MAPTADFAASSASAVQPFDQATVAAIEEALKGHLISVILQDLLAIADKARLYPGQFMGRLAAEQPDMCLDIFFKGRGNAALALFAKEKDNPDPPSARLVFESLKGRVAEENVRAYKKLTDDSSFFSMLNYLHKNATATQAPTLEERLQKLTAEQN